VLGPKNVQEMPMVMGSEDFSYYGEKIPAAFGLLGMADSAKGTDQQHHSPHFKTNDAVLSSGSAILAGFALKFLEERSGR
jgi:metal-dependent amidase/aminoacylase/carboxypeptidase family protein